MPWLLWYNENACSLVSQTPAEKLRNEWKWKRIFATETAEINRNRRERNSVNIHAYLNNDTQKQAFLSRAHPLWIFDHINLFPLIQTSRMQLPFYLKIINYLISRQYGSSNHIFQLWILAICKNPENQQNHSIQCKLSSHNEF